MREDDARREDAVERRKKMAEHHLEKPPLQTGEEVSDVGAREEVAFKPDEWTMRRRIAGKLGVLFIALMVLIGFVVIWLMWMIFQRYYAAPEEARVSTSELLAGSPDSSARRNAGSEVPRQLVANGSDAVTKNEMRFAIPREQIRQLVPPMGGCLATDEIMVEGRRVGYMYREHPDREADSGWRFFAGDESQEYVDDPSHLGLYAVNTVANYDPDMIRYLDTPPPCAFEKIPGRKEYRLIEE